MYKRQQLSSIIHQNIYLFDETILDNICLHEDYPKEIVDKVIKESGLDLSLIHISLPLILSIRTEVFLRLSIWTKRGRS